MLRPRAPLAPAWLELKEPIFLHEFAATQLGRWPHWNAARPLASHRHGYNVALLYIQKLTFITSHNNAARPLASLERSSAVGLTGTQLGRWPHIAMEDKGSTLLTPKTMRWGTKAPI